MDNKKPILLFRKYGWNKEEIEVAKKYFDVTFSRVNQADLLVIGRYSVIPFYHELQNDLLIQNSHLINSTLEHQYIACFDYYYDLTKVTPKTWFEVQHLPEQGPFFLKGKTNSRKIQGLNNVRAENKKEAIALYFKMLNDPELAEQGIIFRDFVNLEKISEGVDGFPFSNEWRLFFYKDELLAYGYYWVNSDIILSNDQLPAEALDFAKEQAKIVMEQTNFFVMDIARTAEGKWIIIELNDGQQSGLSNVDPEELYSNLAKALKK